jgi:hypothetical protein
LLGWRNALGVMREEQMKKLNKWEVVLDCENQPNWELLSAYVDSRLWEELNDYLQDAYRAQPELSFSFCSAQRGWNVKYTKSGRALCTLYPQKGSFLALVVVGRKEEPFVQGLLPDLSQDTVKLYDKTPSMSMGRWLMIEVRDEESLRDVKALIGLRLCPQIVM